MTNSKWFWMAVGILLAMFVFPMVSGMLASRKK